jgi:hypothetical protein
MLPLIEVWPSGYTAYHSLSATCRRPTTPLSPPTGERKKMNRRGQELSLRTVQRKKMNRHMPELSLRTMERKKMKRHRQETLFLFGQPVCPRSRRQRPTTAMVIQKICDHRRRRAIGDAR